MELISSIGVLIAGIAAGIAGHFISHDLYSEAPRFAKRLLAYAVTMLPELDRERYEEEWLSHLSECAGVIGKLRHAIECLLVARKLGRIVALRSTVEPHAVEFVFLSDGQGIAKVSMDSVTALPLLTIMQEAHSLETPMRSDKPVLSDEIKELFADANVKRTKLVEFKSAVVQAQRSGRVRMEVNVTDRFGRMLTTAEMESWLDEHEQD